MSKVFSFGHSADWHFGALRKLIPNSTEYLDRQEAVFLELVRQVEELEHDFFLLSGDIFEDSGTTIPEFLLAKKIFTMLAELLPTVVSVGNHDELQVGEFQSKWLRELKIPSIQFIDRPKVVKIPDLTQVLVMPWTGIKVQDEFDQLVMKNIAPDVEIVMLHECFRGSRDNNNRPFPGGVEVPDIPGVKYFALGDIHIPQQVNLKHAWFSGSPMQYRFDDDPKKGFLSIEKHDDREDFKVEFKRLQCPRELKIVHDVALIDPEAPVWYSLYCPVDKIPIDKPKNLIKIKPQPVRVEIPDAVQGADELHHGQVHIDYAEGIDQIMGELGYSPEQIAKEQAEVRELASRV